MPALNSRLYIWFAQDAPRALILRRGPTLWWRLTLWHTDNDSFEDGQWFRGKIHWLRSDLSPDGQHFVYVAEKQHFWESRHDQNAPDQIGVSWTAISRVPDFTAVALWNQDGGGVFESNTRLRISFYHGTPIPLHPDFQNDAFTRTPMQHKQPPYFSTYPAFLMRHGWQQAPMSEAVSQGYPNRFDGVGWQAMLWRKDWGDYTLMQQWQEDELFYVGKAGYYPYLLEHRPTQTLTHLPEVTWADWDTRGRLVVAQRGNLGIVDPAQPDTVQILKSFNDPPPRINH